MDDKTVRDAMLDTVLKQINENKPPEARETYDRLIDGGRSNSQALQLMAACLRDEMGRMLTETKPFDEKRYVGLLAKIPSGDG